MNEARRWVVKWGWGLVALGLCVLLVGPALTDGWAALASVPPGVIVIGVGADWVRTARE